MPKQMLKLEPSGPANVEVSWNWNFKNLTVSVDGQPIGTVPNRKELQKGQGFPLPQGGLLEVKLTSGLQPMLRVTRDGEPLPGSATHPDKLANTARGIVYFIAGLNLLIGALVLGFQVEALIAVGFGIEALAFGVLFLFLALMVHLRESWVALVVAIVLFSLDAIVTVGLTIAEGHPPGVGGIIFRVFLIAGMVRGVPALYERKTMFKPDVGGRGEGAGSPVAIPVRGGEDPDR